MCLTKLPRANIVTNIKIDLSLGDLFPMIIFLRTEKIAAARSELFGECGRKFKSTSY